MRVIKWRNVAGQFAISVAVLLLIVGATYSFQSNDIDNLIGTLSTFILWIVSAMLYIIAIFGATLVDDDVAIQKVLDSGIPAEANIVDTAIDAVGIVICFYYGLIVPGMFLLTAVFLNNCTLVRIYDRTRR